MSVPEPPEYSITSGDPRWRLVISDLATAIELRPDFAEALGERAALCQQLLALAIEDLERALADAPEIADPLPGSGKR